MRRCVHTFGLCCISAFYCACRVRAWRFSASPPGGGREAPAFPALPPRSIRRRAGLTDLRQIRLDYARRPPLLHQPAQAAAPPPAAPPVLVSSHGRPDSSPGNPAAMPSNQNVQGGKTFGLLKAQQTEKLEEINKEYMEDQKYRDEEDLAEKLDSFKNMMGLKRMMEKLGVPKTHLEVKKMICEVTGGCSDTINYRDFVKMMLGKRSAVLKLVMIFEDKANGGSCKPEGPPPKRDIASLP
uniref:Allograft inflammatory factor 1-like EF-hand domain-containing protein n=1 Tax=Denticeps clupeoides TaxID=299321 RepID=A0AAY4AIK5_9TELE